MKFGELRERTAFRLEFGADGEPIVTEAMRHTCNEYCTYGTTKPCPHVGTHTVFPSDMSVVVTDASLNAQHFVKLHPARSTTWKLDGPGWVAGLLIRDIC